MKNVLKIGFTGDVCFSGFFDEYSSFKDIFPGEIINWLSNNNFNVMNIEGPISTKPFIKKYHGPSLANNPKHINFIKQLKGNIFSLANNHIMDCGLEGLRDTIEIANKNQIMTFGAGIDLIEASRPLIIGDEENLVALFGISEHKGLTANKKAFGIFSDKYEEILEYRIREVKKKCDWVILIYHGGEEYTFYPMPSRRNKLIRYLKYGIDVIVSHHSHTIQGYEEIEGKLIFYSLGNFIFDSYRQYQMTGTSEGMLLGFDITKKYINYNSIFFNIDKDHQKIKLISYNNKFSQITSHNYNKLWEKEASRRFFVKIEDINYKYVNKKKYVNKLLSLFETISRIIRQPYFFRSLLIYFKDPNLRPIFLSAVKYQVKKKLALFSNGD